jgi:hypothetical protein
MEIESTNNHGQAWRDSRWLVLVEFALVVAVYVARQQLCLAKISSALKMARLALCLGLKRETGFGRELL